MISDLATWLTDPLRGRDLETNNKTTAVAMQLRGKHASATELLLETVLCNPLPGSCNSWTTTLESGGSRREVISKTIGTTQLVVS
jgi:hypothetical protein